MALMCVPKVYASITNALVNLRPSPPAILNKLLARTLNVISLLLAAAGLVVLAARQRYC